MDHSTPGLPVHHQLPDFTQTHIHWVGDAIQPSHPLLSPSPPTFNLCPCCIAKWISYMYTYIPSVFGFPSHLGHHRALIEFPELHSRFSLVTYFLCQFSSVQSLSRVQLFATPWTTAHQASLSITNSRSPPKPIPLSPWCHPTISCSVVPFSSCLQSFPASGSFPRSQLFTSGGQSIGVSASTSVLPMNFLCSSVYMSIPVSQFIPPPFPLLVSLCLFSTSVSLFLLCK